ncbi:MAG: DUF2891 domain-containing protein [Alphaproteobacteria bacterium]|nr:DUF2891 domain-containing protein [Alphaproteobacteria bacterium]
MTRLTQSVASRFATIALGHVGREYPNKLDHVLNGPDDVRSPQELHPIFFGSFDWHSCVHGHWLLARLYRRFPALPEAAAIRTLFDRQFCLQRVEGELAYLQQPGTRGFERPYGWAWALMLAGELARHARDEGRQWASALKPLADAFVHRFESYLPLCTYPVRAGVHSNTAFALLLARDYAQACGDAEFEALCAQTARRWYGDDRDYRSLEPSQDEFLSPTLMEAALMSVVLTPEEFTTWFAHFLPGAAHGAPANLFSPATVSDRSDGKIAHLDGLNLSRAWCLKLILAQLSEADPLVARAQSAIDAHLTNALEHVAGDYMGEHWLASFALLALDPDPA